MGKINSCYGLVHPPRHAYASAICCTAVCIYDNCTIVRDDFMILLFGVWEIFGEREILGY